MTEALVAELRASVTEKNGTPLYPDASAHLRRLILSAADHIEAISSVLTNILRSEYDGDGLTDCIDNSGGHYQSQYLADQIKAAEALLSGRAALKGEQ